jgi:predicted phosphodiesterase
MTQNVALNLHGEVLFAGDWHGSYLQGKRAIDHAAGQGIATVVQLGDFGIWDNDKPYLNKLDKLLRSHNMMLFFVDGNHEDFPRLYAKQTFGVGSLRPVRDHIHHLPRGTRVDWDGVSVLAMGGAASIDKNHRRKGYSWWEEEFITPEQAAHAIAGGPADMMWCHDSPVTAPNSVVDAPKTGSRQLVFRPEMVAYSLSHRERLAEITNQVKPRILLHGHYHAPMSGYYRHEGDPRVNLIRGLDEGTAPVSASTLALTPSSVKSQIETLDTMQ